MKPSDFATREEWIAAEKAQLEKEEETLLAELEKLKIEAEQRRQESKRIFSIDFYTYDFNIPQSCAVEWFREFTFSTPVRMHFTSETGSKYVDRKYNKAVFDEELSKKNAHYLFLKPQHGYVTLFDKCDSMIHFSTAITADMWKERKDELLNNLNSFFLKINGAFGMIYNNYDSDYVHKSNYTEEEYEKLNNSDYIGIKQLPKTYDKHRKCWNIDPALLPAGQMSMGGFTVSPAPYMWFGPGFTCLFPKRTFEKFKNCIENIELASGYRRIILGEDLEAYNDPSLRKNQWAFKKKTRFEKIMDSNEVYRYICGVKDNSDDASVEFRTGRFSHGGELLASFYLNEKGQSCSKSCAVWKVTREMKGNDIVWHERIRINDNSEN